MKPTKEEFLKRFNISESEFTRTKLKWTDLLKIHENHSSKERGQLNISNFIFEILSELDTVHSIRRRIKDPEHLIEKIIRKTLDKPEIEITTENYSEKITDLIGVRVLHLYKEDWLEIHNKILSTWSTVEKPTANIRKGDNEEVYINNGCDIKEHKYGYRSVHYLIEFPSSKDSKAIVEIQVRTLFEEAWSEIDHKIRYPYDIDNPILAGYLVVFNSLAGSADQMGSFIKILKKELDSRDQEIEEKDEIIKELKEEINKSKLDDQEKTRITEKLNEVSLSNIHKMSFVGLSDEVKQALRSLNDVKADSIIFNTSSTYSDLSKVMKQYDSLMNRISKKELKNEDKYNIEEN